MKKIMKAQEPENLVLGPKKRTKEKETTKRDERGGKDKGI